MDFDHDDPIISEEGWEDAIRDIYYSRLRRNQTWEDVILNMKYPIYIEASKLWDYKLAYYSSYIENYSFVEQIHDIKFKVFEEMKKRRAIAEVVFSLKTKIHELFLVNHIKKYII